MYVVVTEAASQVAYHLLYLFANGDILEQQRLNLILCDRTENKEILEGVRYELQDGVFRNLASVKISCNFCEEFRTADLAIILPFPSSDHQGYSKVEVSHSYLQERDFPCLEGAVHKSFRRKDSIFIQARGPLSKAVAIGKHIKQAYQDSIKVVRLPKQEDSILPMLSSVQIYGVPGCDLYDELILPRIYPDTANKLKAVHSSSLAGGLDTNTEEQLYERLPTCDQRDQVLLVYALEHELNSSVLDNEGYEETIGRNNTELWSRL